MGVKKDSYNEESRKHFFRVFGLAALLLLLLACLARYAFYLVSEQQSNNSTQPVIPAAPTATMQIWQSSSTPITTTTMIYWYPYQCVEGSPVQCLFVRQGETVGYWATCLDEGLDRPKDFLTYQDQVDWYVVEDDGLLYPMNKESNLQRFQFIQEEGLQK